ncbi:MAG TPA: PilX N-terminal domain-containing pilus assembly protein [Solirubrobacteraceae bacterium]|jgi:type II secretory pathway pseudopilin PulG
MRAARRDDGFALVTALILMTVIIGLGLSLLFLTDNQQKASSKEQAGESAFTVAEAALNAQIGQLSREWPSNAGLALPERCTPATSATRGCPSSESLKVGYPNSGSSSCPAGTPKDAWGSPLSNGWTTYVRNAVGPNQLFDSTAENGPEVARWAPLKGNLWVRSVGVVQCRMVVLVALIAPQVVTLPFPSVAIAGNWFSTSNNGNKIIINTKGTASESGGVGMRCSGKTPAECEKFREGQVQPYTKVAAPPEQTYSASELATLKAKAKANSPSTYFPVGTCPTSLAELSGSPVYVEGPCTLSFTGNGVANSATKLGFLAIINGTFELNGNTEFFGSVYAADAQKSSGVVVELHGKAKLVGNIIVDGLGGISFGSSGGNGGEESENFIYNAEGGERLESFAGASATRNSFRILPNSQ